MGLPRLSVVGGSLSASRAFWPRRRCRRPSQAGSDHNCTDVSEARTSLLLLLYAEQGRKVDLALIFRIPQTGVSPDSSRPGLVSGQLGRPRAVFCQKQSSLGWGGDKARSSGTAVIWKVLCQRRASTTSASREQVDRPAARIRPAPRSESSPLSTSTDRGH